MNKIKIYGLKEETFKKIMLLGLVTLSTATLSGCDSPEQVPVEKYDVVAQVSDSELQTIGLKQVLDVKGENFKLVTEYVCDDAARRNWRITSDKFLYLTVYT